MDEVSLVCIMKGPGNVGLDSVYLSTSIKCLYVVVVTKTSAMS